MASEQSAVDTATQVGAEPEASANGNAKVGTDVAIFGGGCFWCMEAVFDELKGVTKVVSGYSGGKLPDPSYKKVCEGDTGHAEVIEVTFDTSVLSFRQLCDVFFAIHDPTTKDRQGNDVGTQYRSVIFYRTPEQKADALASLKSSQSEYPSPIVTQVVPLEHFYSAEAYHQEYFQRNPGQMYCSAVISPKVKKFRKNFAHMLKA
jgi:peptide-methionine (S)-S-oxide reductase